MKWKAIIFNAILIISMSSIWTKLPAQTNFDKKTERGDVQENHSKMTCYINEKKVSQSAFKSFLSKLDQIEGTWQCIKIKGGGITRYDAKDKNGIVYHYNVRQEEVRKGLQEYEQSLVVVNRLNVNQ